MKYLTLTTKFIFLTLAIILTSCVAVVSSHDNGKHKGWYKNTNNPHNPNSTNPGNGHKKK